MKPTWHSPARGGKGLADTVLEFSRSAASAVRKASSSKPTVGGTALIWSLIGCVVVACIAEGCGIGVAALGSEAAMIVTISRPIGSRGEELGRAVATALELPYFDHEIIARAALIANVSEQTIEQAERVPSLLTRMIEALGRYPAGFELAEAAPGISPAPPLSSDTYRAFIEQVIQGLAAGSGGVIIGHGAQVVLRGHPSAVHVLVCTPFEQRVRAVAAADDVSLEEAKRRVKQADQERAGFFQRYYQVDWRDCALYDLTLNTGRMPLGTAVEAVVSVARGRE